MRQPMNQISIGSQHEESRSRSVESPRNQQRTLPKARGEQVEDERGFSLIVAAGNANRLVQDEIPNLSGRFDGLVAHNDLFAVDSARRVPTNLAIHPDDAATNQHSGLSPRSEPRPGQIGIETHPARIRRLRRNHARSSLSKPICPLPAPCVSIDGFGRSAGRLQSAADFRIESEHGYPSL
jgi:hypothetical protein